MTSRTIPTSPRTYLDWNATAPLHPAARDAMLRAFDVTGNPSSPHGEGRRARSLVEGAREQIAGLLGTAPRNVTFTSGATEAANWVLTPSAASGRQETDIAALLMGATEHPCVLSGHRFAPHQVSLVPVSSDGLVDVAALAARVGDLTARHGRGSVMVALQAANNETGVLQPIEAVAAALKPHAAVLVCDAVQAIGRAAPARSRILPEADIVFLSAHKLGGPKGAGAVVFRDDAMAPEPLVKGGGQEKRQRSGTENVGAIVGFAAALAAQMQDVEASLRRAHLHRDAIEAGLKALRPDTVVFGERAPRLANTTCFAVPGIAAEMALVALDLAGVAVSSGAACSSGKVAASPVLGAMRVPDGLARGALRVSTGPATTSRDVEAFLDAWRNVLQRRAQRAA